MSALLALVPLPYRWLMLIALSAALWGHGYLTASEHDEDARNALQARWDKTTGELLARSGERARRDALEIKERDKAHAADRQDIRRAWAADIDRLRKPAGGDRGAEPVRGDTAICGDPARDRELSSALAIARVEFREATAAYRAGVGELLAACQLQTADLIDLQGWVQHMQLMNNKP